MLTLLAVRYKFMSVTGIQLTVYALKNTFRASFVGIGKCTSTYFEGDAYVCQLVCISQQRGRYFTQGIKTLDNGIEHYYQVNPHRKAFGIMFSTLFLADLKNF
jgi:hypothetical protein